MTLAAALVAVLALSLIFAVKRTTLMPITRAALTALAAFAGVMAVLFRTGRS